MKTSFLIVTFRRDLPYLRHCLDSIARFATGFSTVIVLPAQDVDLYHSLFGKRDGVTVKSGVEWPGKGMTWHLCQQVRADEWSDAEFIAHIDADCILSAPVTPETYVPGGKPILRYEPFERVAQREPGVMAWREATAKCLPYPAGELMETMRAMPLVYHRSTYKLARDLIERRTGQKVDDYIRSCQNTYPQGFCEFVTLGNVAIWEQPRLYTIVEQHGDRAQPTNHVIQFWSHGAPDLKQKIWLNGEQVEVVPINLINDTLNASAKVEPLSGNRPLPEKLLKITHREKLGEWLNEQGMTGAGAEIGVMHGGYAEIVLNSWKGQRYYMVDPWERQPAEVYREQTDQIDYEAKYQECVAIASRFPIVKILRAYSVEAAKQVPDNSLDWVFIDGNHSYRAVLEDLDAWVPKVKPGGLIGGHDYGNDTNFPHWCEVKSAVDRWMGERNIAFHLTPCSSWWAIKP